MSDIPAADSRFDVPTGNPLMAAVSAGPGACAVMRARFAGWPLEAALNLVVMNALDPLLLWVVLGVDEARRWLPGLVAHYRA